MTSEELVIKGEEAIRVADALNSTSFRILKLLLKERLDISEIAKRLGLSQAYVSEQIQFLAQSKLVRVDFQRGRRGIKKICELAARKITLVVEL